jgi:hypothetical protein
MMDRFLHSLMFRFKLGLGMMGLALVLGMFSHHKAPVQTPVQPANPWGNSAGTSEISQYANQSGIPRARPQTSTYSNGYDSEAAQDEEFRRRKLREWREMEERESQGVNAPTYHQN